MTLVRPSLRLCLVLLTAALGLSASGAAFAQDELRPMDGECAAPISTCSEVYESVSPGIYPVPRQCPLGYECVCVPSCVGCKDCRAQVCVEAPEPACKTACDCAPGQGCFDGQCINGFASFAPVYCCEGKICPAAEQCQHRDGAYDRCEGPVDPMCLLRAEKVSRAISGLIKNAGRCEQATDCVFAGTSTQCGGTCGAYVNRRNQQRVVSRIKRLDRRICDSYQKDGCPFATPACLPTVPACVENQCVGIFGPTPIPLPRPIPSEVPVAPGQLLELEARPR